MSKSLNEFLYILTEDTLTQRVAQNILFTSKDDENINFLENQYINDSTSNKSYLFKLLSMSDRENYFFYFLDWYFNSNDYSEQEKKILNGGNYFRSEYFDGICNIINYNEKLAPLLKDKIVEFLLNNKFESSDCNYTGNNFLESCSGYNLKYMLFNTIKNKKDERVIKILENIKEVIINRDLYLDYLIWSYNVETKSDVFKKLFNDYVNFFGPVIYVLDRENMLFNNRDLVDYILQFFKSADFSISYSNHLAAILCPLKFEDYKNIINNNFALSEEREMFYIKYESYRGRSVFDYLLDQKLINNNFSTDGYTAYFNFGVYLDEQSIKKVDEFLNVFKNKKLELYSINYENKFNKKFSSEYLVEGFFSDYVDQIKYRKNFFSDNFSITIDVKHEINNNLYDYKGKIEDCKLILNNGKRMYIINVTEMINSHKNYLIYFYLNKILEYENKEERFIPIFNFKTYLHFNNPPTSFSNTIFTYGIESEVNNLLQNHELPFNSLDLNKLFIE